MFFFFSKFHLALISVLFVQKSERHHRNEFKAEYKKNRFFPVSQSSRNDFPISYIISKIVFKRIINIAIKEIIVHSVDTIPRLNFLLNCFSFAYYFLLFEFPQFDFVRSFEVVVPRSFFTQYTI